MNKRPIAIGIIVKKVVCQSAKVENALSNYWKLKAIDAIQMLSREESNRLISTLIDDQEIRSILLNEELQLIEAQNKTV